MTSPVNAVVLLACTLLLALLGGTSGVDAIIEYAVRKTLYTGVGCTGTATVLPEHEEVYTCVPAGSRTEAASYKWTVDWISTTYTRSAWTGSYNCSGVATTVSSSIDFSQCYNGLIKFSLVRQLTAGTKLVRKTDYDLYCGRTGGRQTPYKVTYYDMTSPGWVCLKSMSDYSTYERWTMLSSSQIQIKQYSAADCSDASYSTTWTLTTSYCDGNSPTDWQVYSLYNWNYYDHYETSGAAGGAAISSASLLFTLVLSAAAMAASS